MIKASSMKAYLSRYKKLMEDGDKWLNKVPSDISAAFFDNDYVNSIENRQDLTMKMLFDDMYEDISWFLYEWNPSRGEVITAKGVKYNIKNLDQYISYLIKEHMIEDDLKNKNK